MDLTEKKCFFFPPRKRNCLLLSVARHDAKEDLFASSALHSRIFVGRYMNITWGYLQGNNEKRKARINVHY